jgi:hypothetical protein
MDSSTNMFKSENNQIATYAMMVILKRMKNELGLEAMLEYMDVYLQIIEKNNHKLKYAVAKALTMISIENIYREAMKDEKS